MFSSALLFIIGLLKKGIPTPCICAISKKMNGSKIGAFNIFLKYKAARVLHMHLKDKFSFVYLHLQRASCIYIIEPCFKISIIAPKVKDTFEK